MKRYAGCMETAALRMPRDDLVSISPPTPA
jgi:hypothetical protein